MSERSFLQVIGGVLASLTQANADLSASILQRRRQDCLNMSKLDASLKLTLSQPWSASTLFNGKMDSQLALQRAQDTAVAHQD